MAEYVDKDELYLKICKKVNNPAIRSWLGAMLAEIPAADTAEVQRGHWEFPIFTDSDDGLDPRVKCSECGGIEAAFARWKYCPNCGAKMVED